MGLQCGRGQGLILPRVPQALVDHERMEMLRGRRQPPLSTSTFDYATYHSLDEVSKCKIRGILGGKIVSWNCSLHPLLHVLQGQGVSQA